MRQEIHIESRQNPLKKKNDNSMNLSIKVKDLILLISLAQGFLLIVSKVFKLLVLPQGIHSLLQPCVCVKERKRDLDMLSLLLLGNKRILKH